MAALALIQGRLSAQVGPSTAQRLRAADLAGDVLQRQDRLVASQAGATQRLDAQLDVMSEEGGRFRPDAATSRRAPRLGTSGVSLTSWSSTDARAAVGCAYRAQLAAPDARPALHDHEEVASSDPRGARPEKTIVARDRAQVETAAAATKSRALRGRRRELGRAQARPRGSRGSRFEQAQGERALRCPRASVAGVAE